MHHRLAAAATLLGSVGLACAQGARPPLHMVQWGEQVTPLRIAPATVRGGAIERVGAWTDYATPRGGHDVCRDYRVFDCYGDHDWNGVPDDWGACGLGSSRWHFGSGYCNGFATNDMTLAPDAIPAEGAWRTDVAWYWTGPGFDVEQCVMVIFTETSDADICEPDSFDLPGWIIDFGDLVCNPGHYYYARIDISLIGRWSLPSSGKGSYGIAYLTDDGALPATCAQPMLWGSHNNLGDPDGPGEQGPNQFDDIEPADGTHDPGIECYDYAAECPNPLGAMAQFWGERLDPPGNRADFDGDGFADTRDFIAFLRAWRVCDPEADCTANGRCDSADVLCFLDTWATCRD
ncbi:MAG: hypothetical protein IPJ41_15795 [Phycisphaerales bacterium]|nr:hypothetical protein [Phycisphaerales bacterium]